MNMYSSSLVDGPVSAATLYGPRAFAVDAAGAGVLDILDAYGNALRQLSPLAQ
jgi:hypothetical protein